MRNKLYIHATIFNSSHHIGVSASACLLVLLSNSITDNPLLFDVSFVAEGTVDEPLETGDQWDSMETMAYTGLHLHQAGQEIWPEGFQNEIIFLL